MRALHVEEIRTLRDDADLEVAHAATLATDARQSCVEAMALALEGTLDSGQAVEREHDVIAARHRTHHYERALRALLAAREGGV